MTNVPFRTAVVPWAGISFPKKASGYKLYGKDENGIEQPTGGNMPFFYDFGKRNDERTAAVNRKHPEGSVSGKG